MEDNKPETNVDGQNDLNQNPEVEVKTEVKTEIKPAWMSQLPDDLKSDENLAKYKTMGEAIKSLMEANEPKEEPKEPEAVEYGEFKTKINAEDDPFGDLQNSYVELFKSRSINQEEAEKLIGQINEINTKAKAQMIEKGRGYCEQVVKGNWGKDYESNRRLMAKGYQAIDPDGSLQKSLDETGASVSPAVWEILKRVGSMVSEDTGTSVKVGGNARVDGVPVDYSKPSV